MGEEKKQSSQFKDDEQKRVGHAPGEIHKNLPSQAEGDPNEELTEDLRTPGTAEGKLEDVEEALREQETRDQQNSCRCRATTFPGDGEPRLWTMSVSLS